MQVIGTWILKAAPNGSKLHLLALAVVVVVGVVVDVEVEIVWSPPGSRMEHVD